ncbi:MAG: C-terminal binding protein [Planctomycetaceae bacterium]|nr:C-terminal binding protein [Planctomycetaceae bacterium]
MNIAITDYSFPDLKLEQAVLEPLGHQIVAWKEKRSPAELTELVRSADAVITQFAPVTAEVIQSMERAKVIVRYGIGVDNVDLDAARERNIPVCNVPDYCIDEVADQTLAFLLAATRQVVPNSVAVQSGNWGLAVPLTQMQTLCNLTVGVVGFGRIGREVVRRLMPFKCQVLVFDPVTPPGQIVDAGCQPASLEQILSGSDVITLHCPSTAETRHMLNRESLSQTRRGVVIVNLSRGTLINSDALVEALQSGQVSAAALDVFDPEPIPAGHPLLTLPNVILAAHIASCSVPAVKRLRETAARLAAMALAGESLPNVVNGVSVVPK